MPATYAGARLIACLSILAAACSQSARAADPFLSSSVSIGNLRYRLIDLDTRDGITPGLIITGGNWSATTTLSQTPTDGGYGDIVTPMTMGSNAYGLGPFGTGNASTLTPDASIGISVSGTQANISMQLRSEDVKSGSLADPYGRYSYSVNGVNSATGETGRFSVQQSSTKYLSSVDRSASVGVYSPGNGDLVQPLTMQLTANTLLVIEGTSTFNATVDRSNLLGAIVPTTGSLPGYTPSSTGHFVSTETQYSTGSVQLNASVILADSLSGVNFGSANGNTSVFITDKNVNYNQDGFDWSTETGESMHDSSVKLSDTFSKDWTLSLANLDGSEKTVYLATALNSTVSQQVQYSETTVDVSFTPNGIVVPSVPEPSTYALMGLGLAGVVVASRRRVS
ncbi:MAG: PEP-CTERM sorting domain-containing protein [Aquabacterium sp.]|nr:PEP-CTERM sorting domain-containing protein [Aquabacterium sp.]